MYHQKHIKALIGGIRFFLEIKNHSADKIFDKKNKKVQETEKPNVENIIVNHSNIVLGRRVRSVCLPPNYSLKPKTEAQVMDWLRNKIQNRHSFAYSMSLKYGEKLKIRIEQKEPYINN